MSFRWPNKDPHEQLDYSVDWSRFLGSTKIESVRWFIMSNEYKVKTEFKPLKTLSSASNGETEDLIQNIAQTHTDTVATINFGGGINNMEYTVWCMMTDTSQRVAERTLKLRVKDR